MSDREREVLPKQLAARMLESGDFFSIAEQYAAHVEQLRKDDLAKDQDEKETIRLRGEIKALSKLRILRTLAENTLKGV